MIPTFVDRVSVGRKLNWLESRMKLFPPPLSVFFLREIDIFLITKRYFPGMKFNTGNCYFINPRRHPDVDPASTEFFIYMSKRRRHQKTFKPSAFDVCELKMRSSLTLYARVINLIHFSRPIISPRRIISLYILH